MWFGGYFFFLGYIPWSVLYDMDVLLCFCYLEVIRLCFVEWTVVMAVQSILVFFMSVLSAISIWWCALFREWIRCTKEPTVRTDQLRIRCIQWQAVRRDRKFEEGNRGDWWFWSIYSSCSLPWLNVCNLLFGCNLYLTCWGWCVVNVLMVIKNGLCQWI